MEKILTKWGFTDFIRNNKTKEIHKVICQKHVKSYINNYNQSSPRQNIRKFIIVMGKAPRLRTNFLATLPKNNSIIWE